MGPSLLRLPQLRRPPTRSTDPWNQQLESLRLPTGTITAMATTRPRRRTRTKTTTNTMEHRPARTNNRNAHLAVTTTTGVRLLLRGVRDIVTKHPSSPSVPRDGGVFPFNSCTFYLGWRPVQLATTYGAGGPFLLLKTCHSIYVRGWRDPCRVPSIQTGSGGAVGLYQLIGQGLRQLGGSTSSPLGILYT